MGAIAFVGPNLRVLLVARFAALLVAVPNTVPAVAPAVPDPPPRGWV